MKHSIETNEENIVRINKIVYNSIDSLVIINLSRPIKYKPLVMVYINENFLTELEWNSASNNLMNSIWYSNKLSFSDNKISKISFKPIPTFAINPECVEQIDITNDETEDKQLFIWERNSRNADQELGLEENYLESLRCLRQLEPHNKCNFVLFCCKFKFLTN
jgi:Leucine-rich repeat (LRR) protein